MFKINPKNWDLMKAYIVIVYIMFIGITFRAEAQLIDNAPFEECGVKGSITIYDYKAGRWLYSDREDAQKPTLPASTFKIINTLIALEMDVVSNEDEVIPWPGKTDTTKYGYRPNIYHNMSLKEAFENSAGWVYVELAKKIGKDRYREYLSQARYGNGDLSINDPDFWNFGDFGISPKNQVEILVGIYKESLPFSDRSYDILKDIMIVEQTENYLLRAKTGWTRYGGKDIGWWVGYIEKEENTYFFATRIIKWRSQMNPRFGSCRKEITYSVLRDLNFIQ